MISLASNNVVKSSILVKKNRVYFFNFVKISIIGFIQRISDKMIVSSKIVISFLLPQSLQVTNPYLRMLHTFNCTYISSNFEQLNSDNRLFQRLIKFNNVKVWNVQIVWQIKKSAHEVEYVTCTQTYLHNTKYVSLNVGGYLYTYIYI